MQEVLELFAISDETDDSDAVTQAEEHLNLAISQEAVFWHWWSQNFAVYCFYCRCTYCGLG